MISVLVPTRCRVDRLRAMLHSYARTSNRGVSELVFRIDDDDGETCAFLADQHHRVIVGPRLRGYASMAQFFNELAAAAAGDVLMCGNDDMVFKTPDWDATILEVAGRYPDGVFDIGVDTFNWTHYPFSVVSRRVVAELGFLWDPRVFWGDVYLRDVMQAFGRCVHLPGVVVDHDWAGHHPDKDPGSAWYWQETHQVAVDDAICRLRPMVAAA